MARTLGVVALVAVAAFPLLGASCGTEANSGSSTGRSVTTGAPPSATTVPQTTTSQPTARSYEESLGARPVPAVVGRSLTRAQAALVAAGIRARVKVSAQVVDQTAQPETVLSQTPPPGTLVFTSPPTVHLSSPAVPAHLTVTIAVPQSAACAATQLGLTYRFNQGGTQQLFAGAIVRDRSSRWCTLPGTATLVGLGPTGRPDTSALAYGLSNPAVDVLSPDAPPPGAPTHFTGSGVRMTYALGVFWERLTFHSGSPASCTAQVVTPALWQVTMTGVGRLTTTDGTASAGGALGPTMPLPTCRGAISAAIPTTGTAKASVR